MNTLSPHLLWAWIDSSVKKHSLGSIPHQQSSWMLQLHSVSDCRQGPITFSSGLITVCDGKVASSPGHSQLFNVARWKTGGPGTRAHVRDTATHNATYLQKGHLAFSRRQPISSYTFLKEGLLLSYLLDKWSNYNRLHTLEPYLRSATNGSTHKTADFHLAHIQLSRFQVGSRWNVKHVRSCTRPSRFSVCNIEKLGVAWGQG